MYIIRNQLIPVLHSGAADFYRYSNPYTEVRACSCRGQVHSTHQGSKKCVRIKGYQSNSSAILPFTFCPPQGNSSWLFITLINPRLFLIRLLKCQEQFCQIQPSWESLVFLSFLQILQEILFSSLPFHYKVISFILQIYTYPHHFIFAPLYKSAIEIVCWKHVIFKTLFLHKASRLYYLRYVIINFL